MPLTAEKPCPPLKIRPPSWSKLWFKNTKQLQSLASTKPLSPKPSKSLTPISTNLTLLLSDDLLLQIFTKLPHSQRISTSLVCKRWLKLLNRLIYSLKLSNWEFLESGKLISRFPNLTHVDIVSGSVISSPNSGILVSHRFINMKMSSGFNPQSEIREQNVFNKEISRKMSSGFLQNSHFREENVLSSDSPNWRVCEKRLSSGEVSRKMSSGFSPNWRVCKENLLNGDILRKMNSGFSHNWRACEEKLLHREVINRVRRVSSTRMNSGFTQSWSSCEENLLSSEVIDKGLKMLAEGCKNLRKIVVINASELGLLTIGVECFALQELELHKCNDNVLRGIAACENLQVLKLVGSVEGLYNSVVSDIGLTILAQGCKRLVKLELVGCEGSFDGIKAIGQCCGMLEELAICDHRMDGGWLAALSYCENLKSLRFLSCKRIDDSPGPDEYLGSCPSLERLHLQKCQLRDKKSVRAMFMVSGHVREIVIQDCWGLDNDKFSLASACRKVTFLGLEWCSLLTTEGLESVILSLKEFQSLRVVSCKNIKDSEISPALSTLFSALKDLTWRPDTKSLLSSSLAGTGMGKRGGKFFKKA